ncbi:hypothetical protein BTVI_143875 [Pitangus sulphuratus]|nr:hypothetical protein BTVI_143875 [Pitangus sulphuratus]
MTPAELRDLRRDYIRRPGERILTWLVRCWDSGARSHLLEGQEAQQLGSLAQDREIEQGIAREIYSLSLWLRILHAVREKYPFKKYLMSSPRKWMTAEEGIQYLRELAMLELIYCNPDYYNCLEPEKISCTELMWRQVIKGAPASFVDCLIVVYNPKTDELNVDTMCSWIRTIAENLEDSSDTNPPILGRQWRGLMNIPDTKTIIETEMIETVETIETDQ